MSAVAEHITNYLLAASAVAAVLTSLAWLITKVAILRAPAYSHMIWLHTLIGLVVLPAIWLYGPKITLEVLPAPTQSIEVVDSSADSIAVIQTAEGMGTETSSPALISAAESMAPLWSFSAKTVLAAVWFAGCLLMLARLFVDWYRLRRVFLSSEPFVPNELAANIEGGRLRVSLTSRVDGPVCFGLARPSILLPKSMVETSSDEELRMVLAHEAAHIRRGDCVTNAIQRFIEAVFFFHPLVWCASFQLTQQRERVCDNHVLLQGVSATTYAKLLSRIAEQSFERNRRRAVALFEGRLLPRVRLLLDPKHRIQTKSSLWAKIASAVVILICLILSTFRLEAQSEAATSSQNNQINELGEAVKKRLTTFTDETVLTLRDGETGSMKVKENIAGVTEFRLTPRISENGSRFYVELLAGGGRVAEVTTDMIHDGDSGRINAGMSTSGETVLCKIQLTPERRDAVSLVVEVRALFTERPTREETEAMLLAEGKGGRVRLDFSRIGRAVMQHKLQNGRYPEALGQLDLPLPEDAFSPTGADYHYESNRKRYILSSCGKDGVYGNDDDESIFIADHTRGGVPGCDIQPRKRPRPISPIFSRRGRAEDGSHFGARGSFSYFRQDPERKWECTGEHRDFDGQRLDENRGRPEI